MYLATFWAIYVFTNSSGRPVWNSTFSVYYQSYYKLQFMAGMNCTLIYNFLLNNAHRYMYVVDGIV
jgi:hypothetical protein